MTLEQEKWVNEFQLELRDNARISATVLGEKVEQTILMLRAAWQEIEELKKDRDAPGNLLSAIRDQLAWLKFELQHTDHRQSLNRNGSVANSWAVCPIPDWKVKQKIDSLQEDLDAAILARTGSAEAVGDAEKSAVTKVVERE